MPLFRLHRGSLEESLKTTVIVKNFNDVVREIVMNNDLVPSGHVTTWGAAFNIEAYPSEDNNFDERIGWFTHTVKANLYAEDEFYLVGYLSEPLD